MNAIQQAQLGENLVHYRIGGLVGDNSGDINNCHSSATITSVITLSGVGRYSTVVSIIAIRPALLRVKDLSVGL